MNKRTVSKDTPLAEITLRKYDKPYDMPKRELIKRLMLSLGLLQPGDSRDVIVDVFRSVLYSKKGLDAPGIEKAVIQARRKARIPLIGVTSSNIRRQIRRLKEMFLIEKHESRYRITEGLSLLEIFEEKLEKFYIESIISRVKEYLDAIPQKAEGSVKVKR